MNAVPKYRPMTVAEFLDWEERQDERHEFVDGEITAMVGGTIRHSQIAGNIDRTLAARLRGSPCRVFREGVKVVTSEAGVFYPDVLVVCSKLADRDRMVTEPVVIIEVLSDSTEHRDRFIKSRAYRAMDSVRQYVMVAQNSRAVESFRRSEGGWLHEMADGAGDVLALPTLGVVLALAEIYADTDLLAGEESGGEGGDAEGGAATA